MIKSIKFFLLAGFVLGCIGANSQTTNKLQNLNSGSGSTSNQNNNSGNIVNNVVNAVTGAASGGGLSNDKIVSGLKEALNVSTRNAVNITSVTDGFFKNPEIFIPFPPEVKQVREVVEKAGMKPQVDEFVKQLNRAAETAVKEATPIFVGAITSMTIADGMQLLKGGDNAATKFLENKTRPQLYSKFTPVVQSALDKVQISRYWNPIFTQYNKVGSTLNSVGSLFGQGNNIPANVNPDLKAYVTNKALDGLFKMMAKEETKIRKDPAARVNDLLKTVFGSF
jgi:hypothetical protein